MLTSFKKPNPTVLPLPSTDLTPRLTSLSHTGILSQTHFLQWFKLKHLAVNTGTRTQDTGTFCHLQFGGRRVGLEADSNKAEMGKGEPE